MGRYYSPEEIDQIVSYHLMGLHTVQIAEKIGRSQTGVERCLKRLDIYRKHDRKKLKDKEKEIVDLYLKGYSTVKIALMYNTSDRTIARILRDNNVTIRDARGARFSKEDYFSVIDNEYKAYFLGLIIADGCVCKGKENQQQRLTITLRKDDAYLLQAFLNEVGSQNKLIDHVGRTTAHICLASDIMCNDLAKYGVVPRKTFQTYLPIIDDKLMPHLIRGYFDGNGCIYKYKGIKNKVVFYGTHRICSDIQDYLVDRLNIRRTKIFDKPTVSMYTISRQEDIKKFYDYIYTDANIYMIRKKEKFGF